MTNRLALTVLVDNTPFRDQDFCGEEGLSILLETAGKKILFDTGLSGLFLTNAARMGIDLGDLDALVLSHGHIDHTGGLAALATVAARTESGMSPCPGPELVAHTRCLWPKEKDGRKNGSLMSEDEARQQFAVHLSDTPVWITADLVFLGEIPRRFSFEKEDPGTRMIHLPGGERAPDFLTDDSALAFQSPEGLVIITGCSHAGICNITEHAREVCGERRVTAIIGGLHLLSPSPKRLAKTGKYLNRLHLDAVYACHCTPLPAKLALAGYCPVREAGAGMKCTW